MTILIRCDAMLVPDLPEPKGLATESAVQTTVRVLGGQSRLHTPADGEALFIGNSGTTVRFLAALAAIVPGPVTLIGDEHMAKRPISDLVDALRQLGLTVDCETGCPPITVHGDSGFPSGEVSIPGTKSSQYFSGTALHLRFVCIVPCICAVHSN